DGYPVAVVEPPSGDLSATLAAIAGIVAAPTAPRPHVVVGSDTGALAAVVAALEDPEVDALVLAGLPAGAAQAGRALSWEHELEARTTCPVHRNRLSGDLLTRGALADPVPVDWAGRARLDELATPVLALHGEQDEISPLAVAQETYELAPALELHGVADGRHDVLNDKSHRSVAATVVLFLERLRAGAPSTPIVARLAGGPS
ncbi:MAG: hypothetical protein ABUS54_05710, partial [Actinomycetota bacterium]